MINEFGRFLIRGIYVKSGWHWIPMADIKSRLVSNGILKKDEAPDNYFGDAFWRECETTGDIEIEFSATKTVCEKCPRGMNYIFSLTRKQKKRYLRFSEAVKNHISDAGIAMPGLPYHTKCVFHIVSKTGVYMCDYGDLYAAQIESGIATILEVGEGGYFYKKRTALKRTESLLLHELCNTASMIERSQKNLFNKPPTGA